MLVVFSLACSSDFPIGVSFAVRAVSAVSIALKALRSSRAVATSSSSSSVCLFTSLALPPVRFLKASSMRVFSEKGVWP